MNDYLIPLTSACTLITLNYIAMKIRAKMLLESYEGFIAPFFTGIASIIMMLQPLPPQLGISDLRSLPIFMAGLQYGWPVALLSTLFPAGYGLYTNEPDWPLASVQYLIIPALISSFFHNKEYRSGFVRIRIRHSLLICVLLLGVRLLFSGFTGPLSGALAHWSAYLFMLAIVAGTFVVLIVMVNDENNTWRMQRQLELQANQDGLTLLPNLRSFTSIAGNAMKKRDVAILMIDIDNFKQFNDSNGHLAGDQLLREIGALLRNTIHEQDYVARYGGEEFILLSTETEPQRLASYASALCQTVAAQKRSIGPGEQGGTITISVGITVSRQPQDDLKRLIDEADQALYQSKRAGKNRFTFYRETALPPNKKNA